MKKITTNTLQKWSLCAALFAAVFSTYPQIGIGTVTPEGVLDVVSTNNAVILSRVANTAAVTYPKNGMIIYDQSEKCFKGYQEDNWTACGFRYSRDNTTVVEVTSVTGRIWMDRNLGASQVATSSTDHLSYGDLYQWGRSSDGHQLRYSLYSTDLATSATPGHDKFIVNEVLSPYDWLVTKNDDLWQGATGANNPCPLGFRIPTEEEWTKEADVLSPKNASGAYDSNLKLPTAGHKRDRILDKTGVSGYYWSSITRTDHAAYITFAVNGFFTSQDRRSYGYSVRCIKD